MKPIDRLHALRDELLDLTKGRTSDGKPTHIPPPKSASGQAKARAEGYAPTPSGKTWAHSSVRRRGEGGSRRSAKTAADPHATHAMVDAVDTLSDHIVEGMRGDPGAVQRVMRGMQATVTRGGQAPEGAVTPDEMVRDVLGAIMAHARKSPELARKVSELMKRPVHIEGRTAVGGPRSPSPVEMAGQHSDEELHDLYRDTSSRDLRRLMLTHNLATEVDMEGMNKNDLRGLLVKRARTRYNAQAA